MTYEYVCEGCGHQWEAEQSIKDRPLKKCVSCGDEKAKRLVSGGTGFLLKGGGWYADLYGSPGSGTKAGSTDDKAKPNGSAKTDAKTDAAATAKTPEKSSTESKPSASAATSSATASSSSATASSSSSSSAG